jgi:hypothetical protein
MLVESRELNQSLPSELDDKLKGVEPRETSDEILPGRWQDLAEDRAIPDEQIFRSWRRCINPKPHNPVCSKSLLHNPFGWNKSRFALPVVALGALNEFELTGSYPNHCGGISAALDLILIRALMITLDGESVVPPLDTNEVFHFIMIGCFSHEGLHAFWRKAR